MASPSPSNELKIIRVYDAPIKSVWEAWADPSQVGKWWGPRTNRLGPYLNLIQYFKF
jgi:uncharacterized protein YndB with AHSA1/START domain